MQLENKMVLDSPLYWPDMLDDPTPDEEEEAEEEGDDDDGDAI